MPTIHLTQADTDMLHTVKAVIEKECATNFTHQQLAQMAGTNETKLRVGFKQLHNKTIHAFQFEVRLAKAKELLETTTLPLKLIALQLGWDVSNMVKQFKLVTGHTPIQWRAKNTKLMVIYIETRSKRGSKKTELPINSSDSPLQPV